MNIAIIDYGSGNVFSVQQAFLRLGLATTVTSEAETVLKADYVILPGVGHAKQAMEQLQKTELNRIIPDLKQPFLGICLGMQLLCDHSEEGNTTGLGIFNTSVTAFTGNVLVPHMGWNDVEFTDGTSEAFYFVHSFRAGLCEYTSGTCGYDTPFSAVLTRNNFTGVQFHPEKSGKAGEELLKTFLTR